MVSSKIKKLMKLSKVKVIPYYDAVFIHRSIDPLFFDQTGGLYNPYNDYIAINSKATDHNNVILHELAHWSGHSSRLNRPRIRWAEQPHTLELIKPSHRHTEEFIAELTANRLLKTLNLDHTISDQLIHKMIRWYAKGDLSIAVDESKRASEYLLAIYNS